MIERFAFQRSAMKSVLTKFESAASCSRALAIHPQQVHMIARGVSGVPNKIISRLSALGMKEEAKKLLDAKIKDFIAYTEFEAETRSGEFSGAWSGDKAEG